jgi:hypothetical protein
MFTSPTKTSNRTTRSTLLEVSVSCLYMANTIAPASGVLWTYLEDRNTHSLNVLSSVTMLLVRPLRSHLPNRNRHRNLCKGCNQIPLASPRCRTHDCPALAVKWISFVDSDMEYVQATMHFWLQKHWVIRQPIVGHGAKESIKQLVPQHLLETQDLQMEAIGKSIG